MSSKVDELKLDIEELSKFLQQATRQRTRDVLTLEIHRLQTELSKQLEENISSESKLVPTSDSSKKCYEVKLTNYAWDQSDKFIKIYITLKNVHDLPKERVYCNFSKKSLDLHVLELDNRNYNLPILNLCEEIIPEQSYTKVKTDMICIFLAKASSKKWTHVTGVEKRIKEAKTLAAPDMGDESDPSAGLMGIVKKFYEEGDDEMKRTIAKAWTESQNKQSPGMPPISSS